MTIFPCDYVIPFPNSLMVRKQTNDNFFNVFPIDKD